MHLQFSIDLQAELQKITQRQHLNDVHYLVGLVRHALACSPKVITIESSRSHFSFKQDGDPLEIPEWEALLELLHPDPQRENQQQHALTLLETRYGVSLLSLLLNAENVVFKTGNHALHLQSGQWMSMVPTEVIPGYQLQVRRNAHQREKEASELDFYCAGATIPIYFNGKRINRPLALASHLLALDFSDAKGHGSLCIPSVGELSRYYFFKAGIRVGVKTFAPVNGQVVEGYWNTTQPEFEALYKQTLQTGQPLLDQHTQTLYQAIATQFHHLSTAMRQRLKKILLGLDGLEWSKNYGSIPLFANRAEPFALSYQDLRRLRKRHGVIPFSTEANPTLNRDIPLLTFEDQYFLRQTLRQPLQPLVGLSVSGPLPQKHSPKTALPLSGPPSPEWSTFLHHLNLTQQPVFFALASDSASAVPLANGLTRIWLPVHHPLVLQAREALHNDPLAAHLWRYRLLDTFGR